MHRRERGEHAYAQLVEIDFARCDVQPPFRLRLRVIHQVADDAIHAVGIPEQPRGGALVAVARGGTRKLLGRGEDHRQRVAQLVPRDADQPVLEQSRLQLRLAAGSALEGARGERRQLGEEGALYLAERLRRGEPEPEHAERAALAGERQGSPGIVRRPGDRTTVERTVPGEGQLSALAPAAATPTVANARPTSLRVVAEIRAAA